MAEFFGGSYKNHERLLERLDHMVESGQVTDDEAARLRAAGTAEEFEAAVVAIRTRHAEARLTAVVDAGQMSQPTLTPTWKASAAANTLVACALTSPGSHRESRT